jgi:hypothetical protein
MKHLRYQKIKRLLLLLATILVLAGCAYGKAGRLNSYVAAGFPAEQVQVVADDLAALLAEKLPPGRSAVFLKTAGSHDEFGQKLETALRLRSFILAAEASASAPAVAYVLDQLDEGQCYARLAVADGPTLTCAYQLKDGRLEPQALAVDTGSDHDWQKP